MSILLAYIGYECFKMKVFVAKEMWPIHALGKENKVCIVLTFYLTATNGH